MNAELILEYPVWYFLVCLLVAFGYAYFLYNKSQLSYDLAKPLVYLLGTLRFSLIALLLFFLLSPMLKNLTTEVENPILIIAQDNSASIAFGTDSTFLNNILPADIQAIVDELSGSFDVRQMKFGGETTTDNNLTYTEERTDISSVFTVIDNQFLNRNVGAVVVLSDGLYNKGFNPIYAASQIKYPIYTVALGDSSTKKDLSINDVLSNKIAFVGNQFPVEITVKGNLIDEDAVNLKVENNKSVVFQQKLIPVNKELNTTVKLLLEAKAVGLQKYVVTLDKLTDEVNYENNTYEFFIEIIEGKQKILLLTEGAHPDIAAIRNSISTNENYAVEVRSIIDEKINFEEFNLLIVNQINSNTIPYINQAVEKSLPLFALIGTETDVQLFNRQQYGVSIDKGNQSFSNVQGYVNKSFSLFSVDNELNSLIKQLPPLTTPFGDYTVSVSSETLLFQKIGAVETVQPLLCFTEKNSVKMGILFGEGIWKMRQAAYSLKSNHVLIDQLLQKSIQYLAVKENKKRFRIDCKKQFFEDEEVVVKAQLYNNSYEKVNDPDVLLNFIDEEGSNFEFLFNRSNDEYRAVVNGLASGKYQIKASTTINGENFVEMGELIIRPVQVEALNIQANNELLRELTKISGGKFLLPKDLISLPSILAQREDIKPVSYEHQKLSELINLKWIFFVLLALVSLEWLMRKRNGAY